MVYYDTENFALRNFIQEGSHIPTIENIRKDEHKLRTFSFLIVE